MTVQRVTADAVIIGGGFYGSAIAIYLAKTRGLRRVILLEREPELLLRTSYNNQARVHNGYHYPRSFTTSFRIDPYRTLDKYDRATRVDRMVRDAGRYLPAVLEAKYVDSLFAVKTVLVKNEGDDGRPIIFEKHAELPGCYSVLGGKIDNIYDVLEKFETEEFKSFLE